jgi:hypothetical protein
VKYRHLTKKDAILIQAGSIDVYKNNSKAAIMQIQNFCETLSNTNIIFFFHRYDLMQTSCVNKEIQTYNRKLKKVVKLSKHVTIAEASINREDFTRKGLYLNKAGKRQLAMKIAKVVMEVTEEQVNITIYPNWKHVTKKKSYSKSKQHIAE